MSVILHIDGDGFFAACEIAVNAKLKGKPVVVGRERGIAVALSYEAKALGISRGMPIFLIKKNFPTAVLVSGNYWLYKEFSRRMNAITARYASYVEAYSIDECFAYISSEKLRDIGSAFDVGRNIQETLLAELGISFSVGIGNTKVRAKTASKFKKPFGCTVFEDVMQKPELRLQPVGSVWGIGRSGAKELHAMGIKTVEDFIQASPYVIKSFDKHTRELWYELSGVGVLAVDTHTRIPQSISHTRTFSPMTNEFAVLKRELTRHVESVTFRLRAEGLLAKEISFFIKTASFEYKAVRCVLDTPTAACHEIARVVIARVKQVYVPTGKYRATGVTAHHLVPEQVSTKQLLGKDRIHARLYQTFDFLNRKYGDPGIALASGVKRGQVRTFRMRNNPQFPLPFWGFVD